MMKFKQVLVSLTAAAGMLVAGGWAANADTVTVQAGDTVSSLAKEHGVSVAQIETVNHLPNVNWIYVGQKLEVGPLNNQQEVVPATQARQPAQSVQPQAQAVQQPAAQPTPTANVTSTNNSGEAGAKAAIAQRESGGSYAAVNGRYYGKYQLNRSQLNGDFSAANQEKAADSYVSGRYGSWSNALQHSNQYGWY